MFDVGASELLVIAIVVIVVIGPKDMPMALRTAGRWIGKMRRMSNHFRSGIDEMVRQAEMEDMEKKWAARNAEIMARYPTGSEPEGGASAQPEQPLNILPAPAPPGSAEARVGPSEEPSTPRHERD